MILYTARHFSFALAVSAALNRPNKDTNLSQYSYTANGPSLYTGNSKEILYVACLEALS